jgi:hypothetical protein
LVGLKVRDVCHRDQVAARAIVVQHKSQRPVQFEITPATRDAVLSWIKLAGLKPEDAQARQPARAAAYDRDGPRRHGVNAQPAPDRGSLVLPLRCVRGAGDFGADPESAGHTGQALHARSRAVPESAGG